MAITKQTVEDKIELLTLASGFPVIQIRTATVLMENGVELSRVFHRRMLTPGNDFSSESSLVKTLAAAAFTSAAKAAYQASLPTDI